VLLASTTTPFADRLGSAIVAEALELPDGTLSADVGGSFRAGTTALLQALKLSAGSDENTLCIVSEQITSPPASAEEMSSGDAAAAFITGRDGVLADFLGSHTTSADFVDHFRSRDSLFNYSWESRWIRDEGLAKIVPGAVSAALADAGLDSSSVDRFILPIGIRGAAAAAAKHVGIRADAVTVSLDAVVGNSGAAAPLLELASVLESAMPGEVIVVVAFGSGCDVIVLRRTSLEASGPRTGVSGWLARRQVDNTYLKFLAAREAIELHSGMRGEFDQKQSMTALWRNHSALLGLSAVEDEATGEVTFPPPAGARSGEGGLSAHSLADRVGRVTTFTADRLAYSLDPPTHYGMVDFEGGGRMSAEYCDIQPDTLEVGMPVRMMFRIKALDTRRGFRSYFWKATPDYLAAYQTAAYQSEDA
jgi:3-hydroxy-3-methylglutaryl CoA synthase